MVGQAMVCINIMSHVFGVNYFPISNGIGIKHTHAIYMNFCVCKTQFLSPGINISQSYMPLRFVSKPCHGFYRSPSVT